MLPDRGDGVIAVTTPRMTTAKTSGRVPAASNGPMGLEGASMATKMALNAMHVIAAIPITLGLLRGPLRVN